MWCRLMMGAGQLIWSTLQRRTTTANYKDVKQAQVQSNIGLAFPSSRVYSSHCPYGPAFWLELWTVGTLCKYSVGHCLVIVALEGLCQLHCPERVIVYVMGYWVITSLAAPTLYVVICHAASKVVKALTQIQRKICFWSTAHLSKLDYPPNEKYEHNELNHPAAVNMQSLHSISSFCYASQLSTYICRYPSAT